MSLDVEQRYAALPSRETTHVCTGNVVYRADAIGAVGLFDEALGYGLDNDMSYRLQEAGYRLVFFPDAKSTHYWRDSFLGYCQQQYGLGSGRLDLVAKHPRRIAGDSVSPLPMMLHPVLTTVALLSAVVALGLTLVGDAASGWNAGLVSVTLLGLLGLERGAVGIRAALRFRAPEAPSGFRSCTSYETWPGCAPSPRGCAGASSDRLPVPNTRCDRDLVSASRPIAGHPPLRHVGSWV